MDKIKLHVKYNTKVLINKKIQNIKFIEIGINQNVVFFEKNNDTYVLIQNMMFPVIESCEYIECLLNKSKSENIKDLVNINYNKLNINSIIKQFLNNHINYETELENKIIELENKILEIQ